MTIYLKGGIYMAKKQCDICGKNLGVFSTKKLMDGLICGSCRIQTLDLYSDTSLWSLAEVSQRIQYVEDNQELWRDFSPSADFKNIFSIDAEQELFRIGKGDFIECFPYSFLESYDIVKDSDSFMDDRSIRQVSTGLYIHLKLNDPWTRTLEITIIDQDMYKVGHSKSFYLDKIRTSEKIASILDEIIGETQAEDVSTPTSSVSAVDEILKYKELLDEGIISIDEFQEKKKLLMGI